MNQFATFGEPDLSVLVTVKREKEMEKKDDGMYCLCYMGDSKWPGAYIFIYVCVYIFSAEKSRKKGSPDILKMIGTPQ